MSEVGSPIRQMTAEEKASAPKECFGCGRDAITWCETNDGRVLGYCGYLDSGACLALIDHERQKVSA